MKYISSDLCPAQCKYIIIVVMVVPTDATVQVLRHLEASGDRDWVPHIYRHAIKVITLVHTYHYEILSPSNLGPFSMFLIRAYSEFAHDLKSY